MAGPTFGAAGSQLASGTDTTAAIPVPAGVVANSVVVVFLYRSATSVGDTYEVITPPAEFAEVTGNPRGTAANSADNHSFMCDVLWKRATGSDTGTYDFSWATARFRVGFAVRIDGCVTSGNPFDVASGAYTTSSDAKSTSTPAVSVTTTGADRLLLWGGWSWTTGAWTQPSGFTAQVTNTPFDLITASTKAQAVAGGSGSLTGTQSSEAHAAWVGALKAGATAVTGTVAASLGGLTASVTGVHTAVGSVSCALGGLTAAVTGTHTAVGTMTCPLGGLTAHVTGAHTGFGVVAAPLGALTASLVGTKATTGSIACALGALAVTLRQQGLAAAVVGDSSGWWELLALYRQKAPQWPELACPRCGWPLLEARGVRYCPHGDYRSRS